jgi:hypothetical protein
MEMRISRITVASAVAATLIASGTGLAAAGASAALRPAVSGTEHFSLMTTQPSTSRYVVIASGLFTAGGVDVSGNKVDLVKLPGGSFKINHGTAVHVLRQHLNAKTCLVSFAATGKFTVGQGKGAYKGISGSGKALVSGLAIARRTKGRCNLNATPAVLEQTITATAHVSR